MSLGSLFLIREPGLRGLLYVIGAFFMGVAVVLSVTHEWKAEESRFILLVPFFAGAILVVLAAALRGIALRYALVLFIAVPAVLSWVHCRLSQTLGRKNERIAPLRARRAEPQRSL